MLCRDQAAATRRCLSALRGAAPGAEVLLVDNASRPAAARALAAWARCWPGVRLSRNRSNVPFAAAVNAAMDRARGRRLLWLNNDALVDARTLSALGAALDRDPSAGAAGPLTDAMAPPEQVALAIDPRGGSVETPFLGGFCLMLDRAAAAAVGRLDERFVWGWEDMDYCLRLRAAGRRLLLVRGAFARHEGSRTMARLDPAFRRRTDLANRRLFLEKWLWRQPWRADIIALFARTGAPWDRYRPAVSVVVPVPDAGHDPRPCLDALASCGLPRAEVILAGVPPSANGREAFRPVPARGGWAACLNAGLREAVGDALVVLDPAARVAPGWLRALERALQAGSRVGAAGPLLDDTLLAWQGAAAPRRRHALEVRFLRGACLALRRPAYEAVGGFDERLLPEHADADYCLRLRQAGWEVRLAEDALVRLGPRPVAPSAARRGSAALLFSKWAGHHDFRPETAARGAPA